MQIVFKQILVEGFFDVDVYVSWCIWVSSGDGMQVLVSLVVCKEVFDGIVVGCFVLFYFYGYGVYGYSFDFWFFYVCLSLFECGFVFVIVYVCGGGELGEVWYWVGKLEYKQNSFDDFIVCVEYLFVEGYCCFEGFVISGGSVGGLLIGVVFNQCL